MSDAIDDWGQLATDLAIGVVRLLGGAYPAPRHAGRGAQVAGGP